MSFLTSNPDLSNTIFTDKELQLARNILQAVISREDEPWLRKPQGVVGEYWKRDDTLASCFLIDIACMIDILENSVTDRSISNLYEKVRQLLRPPSTKQFIEVLTEIQVAFSLVQYVSPIKLLKSEDIIEPKVQRAPDFTFQTPEGFVFVETTVFHGGILDIWTQSAKYIWKMNLYPNPKAACPITTSLMDMFNGKATFHYKTWGDNPHYETTDK